LYFSRSQDKDRCDPLSRPREQASALRWRSRLILAIFFADAAGAFDFARTDGNCCGSLARAAALARRQRRFARRARRFLLRLFPPGAGLPCCI